MKIRLLNLLLTASVVSSVMLSSCGNDSANTNTNSNNDSTTTHSKVSTITDSRDGHVYKTVKIGDQVWIAENLAYTGKDIRNITDKTEWENNAKYDAWCYYNNKELNKDLYGVLYQWQAAKKACPKGWHLPTDAEWAKLADYLGGKSVAGGKMKEAGTVHWESPNTGADNDSGLYVLPGGIRGGNGNFYYFGNYGGLWTATQYGDKSAFACRLLHDSATMHLNHQNNSYGFSVRCIKD